MVGQAATLLITDFAKARPEIEDCRVDLAKADDLREKLFLELCELLEPLSDLTPLPKVVPGCPERRVA